MTLSFATKLVDDWTAAVRAIRPEPSTALSRRSRDGRRACLLVLQLVSATPNAARNAGGRFCRCTPISRSPSAIGPRRKDAVILVDGQVTRYIGRSAHWAIGRRIAADLAARPGEGPRVAAWYRATAALMQEWRSLDLLGPHLEAGQTLFVDDPVLALYQGTLRQMLGDARLEQSLRHRGSTEGYGRPPLASRDGASTESSMELRRMPTALPNTTRLELEIARRELRRALTLDPTLHEARIRLAHVLSRLGDNRPAVEMVGPALQAPLPPFLEFYAALILGRSEEHLGRFAEAGVAYARAAALFPGAQSAQVGLSRVALAQGRAPDALKILVDVAGAYATEQQDPWSYYWQHDRDADTLLEAWRADSEVTIRTSRRLRTLVLALADRPSIQENSCDDAMMAVAAMRSLAIVMTVALVAPIAVAAQRTLQQEPPPGTGTVTRSFAEMRVAEWKTAVRTHAAGTVDAPVRTVAGWKREHTTLVVRIVVLQLARLLELQDAGRDFVHTPEVAELTGVLARGLSLHTDIAMFERNAQVPAGMPALRTTGGAVILVDGQQTGFVQRSAHWPIARQIAAELSTRPPERPRVIEWYRATAALMQQWSDCDLLGAHLEAGQALFADDPVLALYQGTLRQTLGDPRLHDFLRKGGSIDGLARAPLASRDGPAPSAPARLPKATKIELGIAERELRRALTLDPALHEARIRLAHVLCAPGRRSAGGRGRPARAGGAAAEVPGVLRRADPGAQRGTPRALRRSGRRLYARRRELSPSRVGRDRPQPRRAGAGAGARCAEDPRRRRRPILDRAAGSLAGLLEAARP